MRGDRRGCHARGEGVSLLIYIWTVADRAGKRGDLVSLSLRATIGGRLRFDFSTTRKRFCPGRWGQGVGCVDAIAYYTSTKKTHGWLLADRSQLEQAVTSKRRRLRAVFRIVTKKGVRQEIPGHRSRGWRQPRTREVSSLAKGWLLADPGWRARDNTTRMVPRPRSELCLAGSHVVPHPSPAVPGSDGPTGSPSPSLLCDREFDKE